MRHKLISYDEANRLSEPVLCGEPICVSTSQAFGSSLLKQYVWVRRRLSLGSPCCREFKPPDLKKATIDTSAAFHVGAMSSNGILPKFVRSSKSLDLGVSTVAVQLVDEALSTFTDYMDTRCVIRDRWMGSLAHIVGHVDRVFYYIYLFLVWHRKVPGDVCHAPQHM